MGFKVLHPRETHQQGHVPHYCCLVEGPRLERSSSIAPLLHRLLFLDWAGRWWWWGRAISDMTSSEVSVSGTAGDRGGTGVGAGKNTWLAISHEIQPGTYWTEAAGSLSLSPNLRPAEQL